MSIWNSFIELVIGDLDEKKAWRALVKRADALPEDYRYVYRKIQHYMMNQGVDSSQLLELFEEGAAEGRPVRDIVGEDVAAFADAFIRDSTSQWETPRDRLNREIWEKFGTEEDK